MTGANVRIIGECLLSIHVPGKVYGRILIEKVCSVTGGLIGEEYCRFRSGRGVLIRCL